MVGSETFKGYATLDGRPEKMPRFKAKTGVLSPHDVRVGPWWVFTQIRVGLVGLKCIEMLRGEAECMFLMGNMHRFNIVQYHLMIRQGKRLSVQ